MRVFLDTNVIVSAVATRGLCADVFRVVLAEHELVTCPQVLDKVERTPISELSVPTRIAAEYRELIARDSTMAVAEELPGIRIKDRDDIGILAAAVGARAQVLVTGDLELLGMKTIRNVRILSPRAFWEELKASAPEA